MGKAGAVVGIVGVLLLIVAMLGTWWTYSVTASAFGVTATGSAEFGLFAGHVVSSGPGGSTSEPINYADSRNVQSVFQTTSILLALGLLMGVLLVVVGALSWTRPNLRKAAGAMGVLAFALALLAPLYLMSALPAAINDDSGTGSSAFNVTGFWGTQSTSLFGTSATATWGAAWAWYLALVGAILLLVGGVVTLRTPRPAAPVAGYPPYPGYAPYPPQAPPPQQPPPGIPPPGQGPG